MPTISTRNQLVQIGVEATAGTAVPANVAIKTWDLAIDGTGETQAFGPAGEKYDTAVVPSREWSTGAISGRPSYDELLYLLAGLIGPPVTTTVNTTGKQHVFTPSVAAEDAIKHFTVERGSSVRAMRAPGVFINDATFTLNRNEFSVAGTATGRRITDAITMTASPTVLPNVPVIPNHFDVFVDSTRGALGTTKMLRNYALVWALTGRRNPVWTIDSAQTSMADSVENKPSATLNLRFEADTAGMSGLNIYRGGSTVYVRAKGTSPVVIGAGPAVYSLQLDFAIKLNAWAPREDQDGVFVVPWNGTLVNDGAGAPFVATLVNAQAALL